MCCARDLNSQLRATILALGWFPGEQNHLLQQLIPAESPVKHHPEPPAAGAQLGAQQCLVPAQLLFPPPAAQTAETATGWGQPGLNCPQPNKLHLSKAQQSSHSSQLKNCLTCPKLTHQIMSIVTVLALFNCKMIFPDYLVLLCCRYHRSKTEQTSEHE